MFTDRPSRNERIRAALPAIAVHLLGALLLLNGLAPGALPPGADPLRMFRVAPPPEPPAEQQPLTAPRAAGPALPLPGSAPEPEGASAPPALKANRTPVVAPEPLTRPPIHPPPTVAAAPEPGTGSATRAGAAPVPAPGTGAGGLGTGTGSGRGGAGSGGGGGAGGDGGGGGGGRIASMPRHVGGDFSYRDIPAALRETGFQGRVALRFLIDVDGRAKQCRIARSSGNRMMDAAACRALEQRFRFRPAHDEAGRPVAIPGELSPYFEAEAIMEPPERRRGDW